MATDFANIVTPQIKKAKSSSEPLADLSNTKKATTKDKPSLFDNLLGDAKAEVKKDEKTTKDAKNTKSTKETPTVEAKAKTTSTLLNKIIIEADKKDTKSTKINSIKQEKIIVKEEKSIDVEVDTKVNVKNIKEDVKEEIKIKTQVEQKIVQPKVQSKEKTIVKELKAIDVDIDAKSEITDTKSVKIQIKEEQKIVQSKVENKEKTIVKEEKSINIVVDTKTAKKVEQKIVQSKVQNEEKIIVKDEKSKVIKADTKPDSKIEVKIEVEQKEIQPQVENKEELTIQKNEEPKKPTTVEKQAIVSNEVLSTKENISEVVQVQPVLDNTKKPTSLLDRMIGNLSTKKDNTPSIDNKQNIQANMFLSSQKYTKDIESINKVKDSKKVLVDNKTVAAVKKSADILELEVTDVKIEKSEESEKTDKKESIHLQVKTPSSVINKLGLAKEHFSNILNNNIEIQQKNNAQILDKEETAKVEVTKEVIEINVSSTAVQAIQSKIIGAQQKLGSMMSDVARNMALNYRPPVTAFRMTLNPANLGSIAIVMKSNKLDGGGLNISMNMSSSATLEAFTDNKGVLQNALQKTFNETTPNVSLEFGMQSDSSNQSFNEQQKENKNSNDDEILAMTNSSDEVEKEDTQSYM